MTQSSILDVPFEGMSKALDKAIDAYVAGPIGLVPVEYYEDHQPVKYITHIEAKRILDDYIKGKIPGIIKHKYTLCATCNTYCGCMTCAQALPCTCTIKGKCPKCGSFVCGCNICPKCKNTPCICSKLGNLYQTTAGMITNMLQIFSNNMNTLTNNLQNVTQTIQGAFINSGVNQSVLQPYFPVGGSTLPPPKRPALPPPSKGTGLATGPSYYNPLMLDEGTDEQKDARKKAIEFRNRIIGIKGTLALYSSRGLRVKSKLYPEREYVFYSHHVSCQVYDRGVNIGRLDVHADGYNVPMGDTHLAAIMKVMFDEKGMIDTALFSPVRDI